LFSLEAKNITRKKTMKIDYDEQIDALYLELSDENPDGVIEITEGINIDTTAAGRFTGIEILKASKKFDINTILSYPLNFNQGISGQKFAEQAVLENRLVM
jgi:uncharacterized protein YuzE